MDGVAKSSSFTSSSRNDGRTNDLSMVILVMLCLIFTRHVNDLTGMAEQPDIKIQNSLGLGLRLFIP